MGRRDRAEQLAFLTHARCDFERDGLEPIAQRLEILQIARGLFHHDAFVMLELAHLRIGGEQCFPLREQKVACVADLDADEIAGFTKTQNGFAQDDLDLAHRSRPPRCRARRRA
ncbi:MAG: hypothetical protein JRJ05_13840 [Deltaproteobacteria bacterium]|nr:hypothetical protein [Deltaproteobacteria bacterium]